MIEEKIKRMLSAVWGVKG